MTGGFRLPNTLNFSFFRLFLPQMNDGKGQPCNDSADGKNQRANRQNERGKLSAKSAVPIIEQSKNQDRKDQIYRNKLYQNLFRLEAKRKLNESENDADQIKSHNLRALGQDPNEQTQRNDGAERKIGQKDIHDGFMFQIEIFHSVITSALCLLSFYHKIPHFTSFFC